MSKQTKKNSSQKLPRASFMGNVGNALGLLYSLASETNHIERLYKLNESDNDSDIIAQSRTKKKSVRSGQKGAKAKAIVSSQK